MVKPLSTAQSVLLDYTTAAKRITEEGEHVRLCETELHISPLGSKVTSKVSVGGSRGKESLVVYSSKETGYVGVGFAQNPDLCLALYPGLFLCRDLGHGPDLAGCEMVLLGMLFFDLLESS